MSILLVEPFALCLYAPSCLSAFRVPFIMPDSVTNMSVEDYVALRDLQVVHADTDLQVFQFELDTIEWEGGTPNDDQIIEVTWKNTLVLRKRVRNRLKNTRWRSHRQHANIFKHVCTDGKVFEFFWRPFSMALWELLPPHGSAYSLVSDFLLREQQRLDDGSAGEEEEDEPDDHDEDDDEQADDEADLEPAAAGAVLAPFAAVSDTSDDSDDDNNDVTANEPPRKKHKGDDSDVAAA